ncbi:MAG: cytochrome P450 [Acidimicrobiales bacterium]
MEPYEALTADAIDLSDLEGFWTRPVAEREGAFRTLRRDRPLAFFEEPETDFGPRGPGYYAVTRYHDVVTASRHPEVFCSGAGTTSVVDLPAEFLEYFGSMINMDDPRHARLRRIVSRAFTPKRLADAEATVGELARAIVAGVAPKGRCDFVNEVAAALPLRIICEMMGIPDSHYQFVLDQTNVILGATDPEYVPDATDIPTAVLNAGFGLGELMKELGERRRNEPTDDLTSALVNTEIDGERLTFDELASFFILLVVAGNETTRNAISWGLVALTDNPDQRQRWAADFDGMAATAVDEIVRWASPVIFMRRTVTGPAHLGDQTFDEGDKLLLFYNSANRDETVFADPYRFDVGRADNRHVGFGGHGPHFCLGAHLARREITVMYRELFATLPDIVAAGEPERLQSMFINGIKRLPAEYTPVG